MLNSRDWRADRRPWIKLLEKGGQKPPGRLRSIRHDTMRLKSSSRQPHELDSEVVMWLHHAYMANS
jgi:hypothetical protein